MSWLFETRSGQIRRPAVAGSFYPENPLRLHAMVERFLTAARTTPIASPKAVVAPHAGYIYSGPIAGSAFAALAPDRDRIRRVVVIGPSHWVPFRGLAACSASVWETPLGEIPVDTAALKALCQLPHVSVLDEAHTREHALEVELPFLQIALGDFKLIPLVVGDAADEEVAQVLEHLWNGDTTRFVISTDLSHYLDYKTAQRVDAATARAIEQLRPEHITDEQACGHAPLRGMLRAARARGLRAHTLDLRNSGDTAGSPERVVGYGAWAFTPAEAESL
ncbi:MAG: AmmeMemoRadiSam system protein B [Verrucomicrobiales bacterium]|nr:AmmeMemoRadiSam system protein B [Verrucomicrobiales bacterium]